MIPFVNDIADFFLPRICPSCGNKLQPSEKIVCRKCFSLITIANKKYIDDEFFRKFSDGNVISGLTSLMMFEKDSPSQHILHSIKYDGLFSLGRSAGRMLGKLKKEVISRWEADLIIPVPLHKLKKAERGYNQSYYIAKGLSEELNIPVKNNILKRIKYTESQTKMNISERMENMDSAFSLKRRDNVQGRRVILVDDVVTTGATLISCGHVLALGGTSKVYAVTLAIALS